MKIKDSIKRELVQEKFRQYLIQNGVPSDYCIEFKDDFQYDAEEKSARMVNVYHRDEDDAWLVWNSSVEGNDCLAIFGCQDSAYEEAGLRRGLEITPQDLYPGNDPEEIKSLILSAEQFLEKVIDNYNLPVYLGQTTESQCKKIERRLSELKNYERYIDTMRFPKEPPMIYKKVEGNWEFTYRVTIVKDLLQKSLNDLVKDVSYRKYDTYEAPRDFEFDLESQEILSDCTLPNGDPEYEGDLIITRNSADTYNPNFSHHWVDWYTIEGMRVFAPTLASIIQRILEGDVSALDDFIAYQDHEDFVPIDDKIQHMYDIANEITDFDYEEKIKYFNRAHALEKAKERGEYFSIPLLNYFYYSCMAACIQFDQIDVKKADGSKKIYIRDFLRKEEEK